CERLLSAGAAPFDLASLDLLGRKDGLKKPDGERFSITDASNPKPRALLKTCLAVKIERHDLVTAVFSSLARCARSTVSRQSALVAAADKRPRGRKRVNRDITALVMESSYVF